jgi:NADH-quinone oxidoreductase subunit M
MLSGIVGFCAYLWSLRMGMENIRTFMWLLLFMQGGLMGVFATDNILWMYAFHEFAIIPTFIAICVWGGEKRKAVAMEMAVYLTLGALVALVGIVMMAYTYDSANNSGTFMFSLTKLKDAYLANPVPLAWQSQIFGILLVGLGALVSLFPLHSWAPKTYNAAPAPFSMLHAGVLKKFGLYFLIQAVLPLLGDGAAYWSVAICALALVNVIGIGLVTIAQRDLKMMVSFSSVSHMGLCFLGIASLGVLGVGGSVILMFGHGLSVAALFICSDIVKKRFGTTDMALLGGAYKRMPICAAFFGAAVFANIGLPGFANFGGELSVFVSLWHVSAAICVLAVSGIIISAIYGLRAFANVFFGPEAECVSSSGARDVKWGERLPLLILLASLLIVGFAPKLILKNIDESLKSVPVYNNLTIGK